MAGFGYSPPPSAGGSGNGDDITSGTVDEKFIDKDIAEQSKVKMTVEAPGSGAYKLVHSSVAPNTVGIASNNDNAKMPVYGMAEEAVSSGAIGDITKRGEIENPAWNWVPNKPLFAGTNGDMTQVLPVSGIVHKVGWAVSPTKIYFEISNHSMNRRS